MARIIPPRLKKGSPEAMAWAARMQAARRKKARIRQAGLRTEKRFFGPRGIFTKAGHPTQVPNPGEQWHEGAARTAGDYSARSKEPTERAFFKGMERAHRDSANAARRLKMNIGNSRTRKNPLAIFGVGNPPKKIHTGIAGVIYSRCMEIRAEKTKFKPGLYRHPFSRKAGVQILALDNGDLLVHSTAGINLWEPI